MNATLFSGQVSRVHRHLMPAPRAVIQSGLEDPILYLERADLRIENPGDISPAFPDVSVAFKLHSECGRLINLFDWLQVC